jgi:hypothetical protein
MCNSISTLLLRNLSDVFGENDPVRRRAAIDEIFHEDAVFYDPNGGIFRVARNGRIAEEPRESHEPSEHPEPFELAECLELAAHGRRGACGGELVGGAGESR